MKIHLIDFGLTVNDSNLACTDYHPATPDYLSPFMARAEHYFSTLSKENKKTLLIANDYWAIVCTIIYFMYSMSWRTHTLNGIALQDMPYLPVEMWLRPAVFNHPRVTGMSSIFREFLYIGDIVEEVSVEFTEERPLGVTFRNSDNNEVFIADIKNDTLVANKVLKRGWLVSKVDGKDVRFAPVSEVQELLMKPKPITVVFLQGVVPESIDRDQNIIDQNIIDQNIRDAKDYISKIENITTKPAAASLAPPPLAEAPLVEADTAEEDAAARAEAAAAEADARAKKAEEDAAARAEAAAAASPLAADSAAAIAAAQGTQLARMASLKSQRGGSKKYRQKKKTKRSFRTRKSRTRKPKTRKGRKTKKKRQKKRTKKKQRTRRK